MKYNIPSDIENLVFIGDIHGNLDYVGYQIKTYKGTGMNNTCIFLCGDVGLGFEISQELSKIKKLEKLCVLRNIYIIAVRGNHDNPAIFNDAEYQGRFNAVSDYSIVNVCNKNILCVGGGTSIDRLYRMDMGYGYWPDEKVIYQPKVDEKIDIIVSHSAPDSAYPYIIGTLVYDYCKYDSSLLYDIQEERKILEQVLFDYKDDITDWYYGHYHSNMLEIKGSITFHLLGINEVRYHVEYSDDLL